jgi:hypothetical protein
MRTSVLAICKFCGSYKRKLYIKDCGVCGGTQNQVHYG